MRHGKVRETLRERIPDLAFLSVKSSAVFRFRQARMDAGMTAYGKAALIPRTDRGDHCLLAGIAWEVFSFLILFEGLHSSASLLFKEGQGESLGHLARSV
jgi:hypothetical protein